MIKDILFLAFVTIALGAWLFIGMWCMVWAIKRISGV